MNTQVVSGVYASRPEAEKVRSHLVKAGLPDERVKVIQRVRADDHNAELADADGVLKEVLVDGTVGTIIGTGLGALGEAALAAANITLLTSSPFVAPLAMIGWGAAVGAVIGGVIGAGGVRLNGKLSDIVLYAIRRGHVTLIAQIQSEREKQLASRVMGASMVAQSEQRSRDQRH